MSGFNAMHYYKMLFFLILTAILPPSNCIIVIAKSNKLKNWDFTIWCFVYIALCLLNCDWLLVTDEQYYLPTDQIAQSVNSASFRPNRSYVSIRTHPIRHQSVKCASTFRVAVSEHANC